MHVDLKSEPWAFLSTKPAGRREIRFAWAVVLVSALFFLAVAPFASTPLAQVPAFIPCYVAILVICDLITAALLFGKFSVLRMPVVLILAGGYLFSASITLAYALTFPGLFPIPWLPVAGPQTSSAMYMFWHSGFPLSIMAYSLFKIKNTQAEVPSVPQSPARVPILATVVLVLAVVCAYTLFATWGHAYIPIFLEGNRTTPLGHTVLFGIWVLSLAALIMLWQHKPPTVLDVWLMVVMCVWMLDIALAAVLNSGRYDLGWYTGRIYGMLSASFLLIVLLVENAKQYARLVRASIELGHANKALAQLSRHDGLTGLANRRFFDEYLTEQMALAIRHQRPLSLVLCDADHFKAYNDHYGHPAGDTCLSQIAAVLDACCHRPADMSARYGGEEFAMILPETDLIGATQVAEAARMKITDLHIPHAKSPTAPHVSISAGVATFHGDSVTTAQELIATADHKLYEAKHLGRNRVAAGVTAIDP